MMFSVYVGHWVAEVDNLHWRGTNSTRSRCGTSVDRVHNSHDAFVRAR